MRLSMRAILLFEKTAGTTLGEAMERGSMRDMVALAWAGMHRDDRDLTVERLIDLVDEHMGVGAFMEEMGRALAAAMPQGAEGGAEGE